MCRAASAFATSNDGSASRNVSAAQRNNHLTLLEGPAHSLRAKAVTSFGDNLRALAASAKKGRIAHVLATRILSET